MSDQRQGAAAGNLRALVYAELPEDATPTDTAVQPLSRHVLEYAQGDVIELTAQRLSEQFGDQPHIIITIRDGDLDPDVDGELTGLLAQTGGGVLVFGVSYTREASAGEVPTERPKVTEPECPECGSLDWDEASRGADQHGRAKLVLQCMDCGAAWDAYLAG